MFRLVCKLNVNLAKVHKKSPCFFSTIQQKKSPSHIRKNKQGGGTPQTNIPVSPGSDVLYENNQKTFFALVSGGSLVQVAYWLWFKGAESYIPGEIIEGSSVNIPEPLVDSLIANPVWSNFGLGISVAFTGLISFYCKRSIAKISLVNGGNKLRFVGHRFLGGFSKPIDVPIGDVSASPNHKQYISMSLGPKYPLFFLVDKENGTFHNRQKLDQLIEWKEPGEKSKNAVSKRSTPKLELQHDLPVANLANKPVSKKKKKAKSLNKKKTRAEK